MNNLNVTTVLALMIGAVLIYAAVKNKDPRDVVREAMGKEPKYTKQGFARPLDPTAPSGGGGTPSFTGGNGASGGVIPLPLVPIPSV